MPAFLAFVTKWWPIVSTIIGLVAGMLGTHNNAALLAGAEAPSVGGMPLAAGGVLLAVLGMFGYIRNHGVATNSLPPSLIASSTPEEQLLGLLAQNFATKRDPRLAKIMDLYGVARSGQ